MLTIGSFAPNFSLLGDDSNFHSLRGYLGRPLVLFFYPKDLTPGCTTEACEFNDAFESFSEQGAQIIGISKDSLALHARFKAKYSLKMLLLTDPDLVVHHHYGAYGEKNMYGKTVMGVIRSTFLIDKQGMIAKAWYKVRVKNHVQNVLEALQKHQQENAEGGSRTRTGIPGRF